jgi:methionyl-tRNA formyltransferase
MGTPELAGESLRALIGTPDFQIVAVVTQPDHPKGRGLKLQPTPVKAIALEKNIPVLQPARARDEQFIQQLRELQPDLIAVAAYGQILPKSILDLPRFGCLNVHTSLLPRYRGAAPIQSAILNGDSETGVTIMKMDVGMDTGAIVSRETTPIRPEDNAQTLHDRLAQLGAELLVKTIPAYVSGKIKPQPQPIEGVSHAPKIKKQDGRIVWTQPAHVVWNRVRGLVPWPGAFTFLPTRKSAEEKVVGTTGAPNLLKIWEAEVIEGSGSPGEILHVDNQGIVIGCGAGALRVLMLQREGGRRMNAREFLAGYPLQIGEKLG